MTALVFRMSKSQQPMNVILLNFINWFRYLAASGANVLIYYRVKFMQCEEILKYCGIVILVKKKPNQKLLQSPGKNYMLVFLEAKKSGVDWYFCRVIIKCPLFNVSCTFRLTWAEVWIHNLTAGAALELAKILMASPERYLKISVTASRDILHARGEKDPEKKIPLIVILSAFLWRGGWCAC